MLRELQAQGVIGAIGAGCNTVDGLISAVNAGAADVLLVAGRWTLLDRTAGNKLLYRAELNGTLVVGGVLNSGCLAVPNRENTNFNYRPITSSERTELLKLVETANKQNVSLLAVATQFPALDRRVGTTLLGAASKKQLKGTLKALETQVPDAFWAATKEMGIRS